MSQWIRDFTDYSAPVMMERKPLDVAGVLAESSEAIKASCTTQKISLTQELPRGPWNILGDATRLRQSFDDLLRNALEAQPDGGAIDVTAEKDDAQLILRFADAGPGVPPERREELFEFGKTTKPGGSGIGSSLAQLVAESHGGPYLSADDVQKFCLNAVVKDEAGGALLSLAEAERHAIERALGASGGNNTQALIGAAVGRPGAGAAIGGGLGLGAGALIGDQLQGQENTNYRQQQQIQSNQNQINRNRQDIEQIKRQKEY